MIQKFKKPRRFFFHYNKQKSKPNAPILTLHYNNKCVFVPGDRLKIIRATNSKINKRQPYVVIQGFCTMVQELDDGTVIVS